MKSMQSEKNRPGIAARFCDSLGCGADRKCAETAFSLFWALAAVLVLSLAMFVGFYRWTLNAPVLPPDNAPGSPITEMMLR